ncbi:MAG: 3'-5' exonuclease [Chlorobi bacterium]|nr:3'-5' exonuclease [Chlorobiota bacterium]
MLENIQTNKILFLDIETVSQFADYDMLDDNVKSLWDEKSVRFQKESDKSSKEVYEKAAILAEFGKIICISVGYLFSKDGKECLRLKSYYGDDEKKLLEDFIHLLSGSFNTKDHLLCAHNGKEFDFPYIARRILINGLKLPAVLDLAGKKPWEIQHLDTLELWKFGDYKHYTSLKLLAWAFNIPTPKDDIDGSEVGKVYWQDNNIDRIVTYCQKDVLAIVQLFRRYQGKNLISEECIEIIN